MSRWQQLWFGFAVSGLEGSDGDQVLPCTPGLLDDPVIECQLRRLGRYDGRRLRRRAAGWVDDGTCASSSAALQQASGRGSTCVAWLRGLASVG